MERFATTKWFTEAFLGTGGGSPVQECACGRVHFSDSMHYDEGEKEELFAKQEKNPKKYIYDGASDGVSYVDMDGSTFVDGCECNGVQRYERFIWANRARIIEYLDARLGDIRKHVDEHLTALRAVAHPDTEVALQVTPPGPILPFAQPSEAEPESAPPPFVECSMAPGGTPCGASAIARDAGGQPLCVGHLPFGRTPLCSIPGCIVPPF